MSALAGHGRFHNTREGGLPARQQRLQIPLRDPFTSLPEGMLPFQGSSGSGIRWLTVPRTQGTAPPTVKTCVSGPSVLLHRQEGPSALLSPPPAPPGHCGRGGVAIYKVDTRYCGGGGECRMKRERFRVHFGGSGDPPSVRCLLPVHLGGILPPTRRPFRKLIWGSRFKLLT